MMNYRLTLLSPVHIGSGRPLTPLDFVLENGSFAVMNLRKILYAAPHRAEVFAAQAAEQSSTFMLADFLTKEERQGDEFRHYHAAVDTEIDALFHENKAQTGSGDVLEAIKTPCEHHVYIPGSTLKGALRTAFAYTTLREDETLLQILKERLAHIEPHHSDEIVNDLLFWGARRSPQFDLFRAVHVSESSCAPATPETLAIAALKILSLYEARKPERPRQGTMFKQLEAIRQNLSSCERSPLKPGWTFLEVLPGGSTFQGTLNIVEPLLQHRQFLHWNARHQQDVSHKALINAANTFASDVCQWELDFFETQVHGLDVTPVLAFYRTLHTHIQHADSRCCFLCVGYGAGWHKLSIGLLLEKASGVHFGKLRKDLRMASHRLQFPYPKSRKLLMTSANDIDTPLGWVRFELS